MLQVAAAASLLGCREKVWMFVEGRGSEVSGDFCHLTVPSRDQPWRYGHVRLVLAGRETTLYLGDIRQMAM